MRVLSRAGRSGDRGRTCDWGSENKQLDLINHLHQLTVCIFFYRPFPLGISGLVGWEAKVSLSVSASVPLRHEVLPLGWFCFIGFPAQGGMGAVGCRTD